MLRKIKNSEQFVEIEIFRTSIKFSILDVLLRSMEVHNSVC